MARSLALQEQQQTQMSVMVCIAKTATPNIEALGYEKHFIQWVSVHLHLRFLPTNATQQSREGLAQSF